MGRLIIILAIIAIGVMIFPYISRMIRGWAMRKIMRMAEERLRRNMGMPPGSSPFGDTSRDREEDPDDSRRRKHAHPDEPLIPKEYAEDVEFTEIREYSASTEIQDTDNKVTFRQEEQVTDAEYVVIRPGADNRLPSEKKSIFRFFKKSKNR